MAERPSFIAIARRNTRRSWGLLAATVVLLWLIIVAVGVLGFGSSFVPSVIVSLVDAQRYGELDWEEARSPVASLDRSRLPAGLEARYDKALEKKSKPLSSLVGKIKGAVPPDAPKGTKPEPLTEEELTFEATAAFRQAMGFDVPAASEPAK